jgi:predicted RNase H-like HicB family nuclease
MSGEVERSLRLPVVLVPEGDGGFAAFAATLPGAASQGDTEAEALANIREALEGVLESYRDLGKRPPWRDEAECPERSEPGALTRWVEIHA